MIDWNKFKSQGFDDKRREAHGMTTGKKLFSDAFDRLEQEKLHKAAMEQREEELKPELLKALVSRKPLKVLRSFRNATETLGGLTKSQQEDDDGFYANSKNSATSGPTTYEETLETIPAGIELTFKHLEKSLGTLIFKGSDGQEYAIYKNPMIQFQGSWIKNPGFYGLLFNTDLNQ